MSRFRKETDFRNQEVEFFINAVEVFGRVNYSLTTTGQNPDQDYPGDSESTIEDLDLFKVFVYSEYLDEYVEATITNEMEVQASREIEKRHKI